MNFSFNYRYQLFSRILFVIDSQIYFEVATMWEPGLFSDKISYTQDFSLEQSTDTKCRKNYSKIRCSECYSIVD